MRKSLVFLVLGILLFVSLINYINAVNCYTGMSGQGTLASPCLVNNWTALNATRLNLTAYYSLTANLSSVTSDYTGFGDSWVPIGTCGGKGDCLSGSFMGNFNGNNYTISNLTINLPSNDYIGLFGYSAGNISNIRLVNANVTGSFSVGGLAGYQDSGGIIFNCHIAGNVISITDYAGGLVGQLNGTINNSDSTASIYHDPAVENGFFGGLAGMQRGGTISNSYSTGNVIGFMNVGGLVGEQDDGVISNSYSTGNITGSNYYIAGLVGYQGKGEDTPGCLINNSYSSGRVNGYFYVGGLVGHQNIGTISNSYSSANVNGSGNYIGGLVGYQTSRGIISNSSIRKTSTVITGLEGVGALVGYVAGSITDSSAFLETSSTLMGDSVGFLGTNNGSIITNSFLEISNQQFGSILFLEIITGGTGNILGSIAIGNNSAYVNSSQSYLNRSAKITLNLTGLGITNPQILRDGVVCSVPDCNLISYENEIAVFNVTSWSNYSITGQVVASIVVESKSSSGGGSNFIGNVPYSLLEDGVSKKLWPGGYFSFNIFNSTHSFTLNRVSNSSINVVVRSDSQNFNIALGDSVNVDLNKDKIYDIHISYEKYLSKYAQIRMNAISIPVEDVANGSISDEDINNIIENNENNKKTFDLIILSSVVVLFIIGFIIYYFFVSKKQSRK